jgi:hypothetical protein
MSVTYEPAADLASALRRAADARGRPEEEIGHAGPDWPDWPDWHYLQQEQAGSPGQARPGAST